VTYPSERGRVLPPNLDDRTWQDLVDEVRQLIPRYAPEWTDQHPSDLGITLIELFAWVVEGLIYRLNRVPDKNYVALLNLLGVTRNPPTPAMTFLTFTPTGPRTETVTAGAQFQTQASESQRPVVFETDETVEVVPFTLERAIIARGQEKEDRTATLVGPPTGKYELDLPPNKTVQICLGFKPLANVDMSNGAEIAVRFRLFRAAEEQVGVACSYTKDGASQEPLEWPHDSADGLTWTDSTSGLRNDGTVEVALPRAWSARVLAATSHIEQSSASRAAQELYWIGIRLTSPTATTIGIDRILFNSAAAHNALTVADPHLLGTSTGEPFQVLRLGDYPLYTPHGPDTPPPGMQVEVQDGPNGELQPWTLVDDLPANRPHDNLSPGDATPPDRRRVYRCNPTTGEIAFGDFDPTTGRGHGEIPRAGSQIWARGYRIVGGGASGNVAPGTIIRAGRHADGSQTFNVTATNLGRGFDGSDEESIDDTLRRAPDVLKSHDRAVTADDYETLARQATTDVRIVKCLGPETHNKESPGTGSISAGAKWAAGDPWKYAGIVRAPGTVHVVVVPDQGPAVPEPRPSPDVLADVKDYLDRRRDLTAQLAVHGPFYLPIMAIVGFQMFTSAASAGVRPADVKEEITNKVKAFLHPTRGGPEGMGWQLGQTVRIADMFRAITPAQDVAFISTLALKPTKPLYVTSTTVEIFDRPLPFPKEDAEGTASVQAADYELICAANEHRITEISQPGAVS
jgi:predicted phage baseplate assembly protein